jgi:hypothetical protein
LKEVEVFGTLNPGVGKRLVPVPEFIFRSMLKRDVKKLAGRPALEPDQRRVQHFAVREIPRRRQAKTPETFAAELVKAHDLAREDGYVDACHLCYEARSALRERFPELLGPPTVYGVEERA